MSHNDPASFRTFAGLPVVFLFLRLARGLRADQLDGGLHLPFGTYRSFEEGKAAPSLGTLDRMLVYFRLSLTSLQEKLRATKAAEWPRRAAGEQASPSAEEFERAAEVIRDFWFSRFDPQLLRPLQDGFASSAEKLRWVRGFLGVAQEEFGDRSVWGEDLDLSTVQRVEGGYEPDRRSCVLTALAETAQPLYNTRLAHAGSGTF